MRFRAVFSTPTNEDELATAEWLRSVGMGEYEALVEPVSDLPVDLHIRDAPTVLNALTTLESTLPIVRITSHGVTLYLSEILLWAKGQNSSSIATFEHADGSMFIPMRNIICINFFGEVQLPVPAIQVRPAHPSDSSRLPGRF